MPLRRTSFPLIPIAFFLLVSCWVSGFSALAASPLQPGVEEITGTSLVSGHELEHLKREHALAGEVARTLALFSEVADVRVHLTLADHSILAAKDRTNAFATVVVWTHPGRDLDRESVVKILCAAVPDLTEENVELFSFTRVGAGATDVATESFSPFPRTVVGGLLLVCLVLGGILIRKGMIR